MARPLSGIRNHRNHLPSSYFYSLALLFRVPWPLRRCAVIGASCVHLTSAKTTEISVVQRAPKQTMIQTWEEKTWQGREVRESSPAVVMVDADFTYYSWKVSLRQGRISDRKFSFTNWNFFDLEWHLREKTLIFFPLMLLSQPFWGQDGLVMTHKTSTASAAHFWYNSTCSVSYFLFLLCFHLLLSLIVYTPPFPSSHPWPVSSFCCFSNFQHYPPPFYLWLSIF